MQESEIFDFMAPNAKRQRYLHDIKALIILINFILYFISLQFILIPLESNINLTLVGAKSCSILPLSSLKMQFFIIFQKLYFVSL